MIELDSVKESLTDFRFHYTETLQVNAALEAVFLFLDDPRRLTAHMGQSSWMMAGSKMETELDRKHGQAIGSKIILRGSFLGIPLFVLEVVVDRVPPRRKSWRTVGPQKLIIMDRYQMGFELESSNSHVTINISIDYDIPAKGPRRWAGTLASRIYARWCVQSMIHDTRVAFASTVPK